MKKWKTGIAVAAAVAVLAACGENSFRVDTNTIYIKQDGTLKEASFELFDKEYYEETELKQYVESEIRDYNYRNVKEAITVDKVEVTDTVAAAYLTYQSVKDYIAFNESEMFAGTVKEAMDAGYDFETTFVSYEKEEAVDLLTVTGNATEHQVLILDAAMDVRLDGTIVYISTNVQKKDKKNVTLTQGGLSYIIYK